MGERQNQLFQLTFNASLKVAFQGSRVTSNGGLILVPVVPPRPVILTPIIMRYPGCLRFMSYPEIFVEYEKRTLKAIEKEYGSIPE